MKYQLFSLKVIPNRFTYTVLISLLFFASKQIIAQVGINTTMPDASAMLDVSATDKGLLIPRVSLADVSTTMLDGVNIAATGLLIYNTNAATIGGDGIGLYSFNGTLWEKMLNSGSSSVMDADFFEKGTNLPPDDITDDIFTLGYVAIGKITSNYVLDIEETTGTRGINVAMSGSNGGVQTYGSYIENEGNGTGFNFGAYHVLNGSGNGQQRGTQSLISNSGNANHYASLNEINGNGSGSHYGTTNFLLGSGNGSQVGVNTYISNTGNSAHFGSRCNLNGSGTGPHTGNRIELSGTGSGLQIGLETDLDNSGNANHRGIINSLSGDGSGEHLGIRNNLSGSGGGQQIATQHIISNSGNGIHTGTRTSISGNGTGIHYGSYNDLIANGSGNQFGTYNLIRLAGNGLHTGTYNSLTGTGTGVKYGSRNIILTSAGGTHYGVYSNVLKSGSYAGYFLGAVSIGTSTSNNYLLPASRGSANQVMQTDGTGNVTWEDPSNLGIEDHDFYEEGTTNAPNDISDDMFTFGHVAIGKNTADYGLDVTTTSETRTISLNNSANSGIISGIFNNVSGNGGTSQRGIYNFLSGTGNNPHYGTYNNLNGSGTGNKYGSYNTILPAAGGAHYGVYSEVLKAGSFAGYFLGNVSIGTTSGNNYILPASRGSANQIMQTDGVGQVSWVDQSTSPWTRTGTTLDVAVAADDIEFSSDQTSITFPSTGGTPSSMMYMFASGTSNSDRMIFSQSPAFPGWGLEYEDAGDSFIFKSATVEKVEIDLNGGFPLRVYGTARAVDFQSDTATYPDYVFETYLNGSSALNTSYNFQTLAEVEAFIKDNGHLPGVKSHAEIEAQNMTINLAETSVKNLEKIEELFLYTIELKKENELLKKQLETQESRLLKIETLLEKTN